MKSWIELFMNAGFNQKYLEKSGNLIVSFDGRKYCKACDKWTKDSIDDHMKIHLAELGTYFENKKKQADENRKAGREKAKVERVPVKGEITDTTFYKTPCSACGKGIKRTGKRGKPPKMHKECR